jgi:hypothetical protein
MHADVQVTMGASSTLTYRGLYNGHAPNPGPASTWSQAEPDMMVAATLTVE